VTMPPLYKPGHCSMCGRKLKDPVSIERGYGLVCYRKMQLEINGFLSDVPPSPEAQEAHRRLNDGNVIY